MFHVNEVKIIHQVYRDAGKNQKSTAAQLAGEWLLILFVFGVVWFVLLSYFFLSHIYFLFSYTCIRGYLCEVYFYFTRTVSQRQPKTQNTDHELDVGLHVSPAGFGLVCFMYDMSLFIFICFARVTR